MNFRKRIRELVTIGLLGLWMGILVSCSGCSFPLQPSSSPKKITILSYNVQNLFDDVSNGTEYYEFDPSRGEWTSELFHRKLLAISEVILHRPRGGADIVVLQEVENRNAAEILRDHYLKGAGYRYIAVSEARESAIQIVCLSRFPFTTARSHNFYIESVPTTRPIFECEVKIEGGAKRLSVLANHWKSKSGGVEETERMRIAAADLVKRRVKELQTKNADDGTLEGPVIIGDFNERIDEYMDIGEAYTTALMPVSHFSESAAEKGALFLTGERERADGENIFYTPWLETEAAGHIVEASESTETSDTSEPPGVPGTYVYGGEWERIDGVLLGQSFFDGEGLEYADFRVVAPDFLRNEDGYPFYWSRRTGTGYSDHLPVLLEISLATE